MLDPTRNEHASGSAARCEAPPRLDFSVLGVHGSQATIGLASKSLKPTDDPVVTVGKFIGIHRGTSLVIGIVTEVSLDVPPAARDLGYGASARVDLLGEIKQHAEATAYFQRGVTDYPGIGDPAGLITGRELRLMYDISGPHTIHVGQLQQDASIGAYIQVDEMLSKHFAVLGTTGVGKSTGVALLLQEILAARPKLRVFLLDGHNEYARCFGDHAQVLSPRNLKLPFWLFNFEETIDVIFAGRPGGDEEIAILAEVIPVAKSTYTQHRASPERVAIKRPDPKMTGYTVDTPVPYRLQDLIGILDERMGKLENRSSRMVYHKLISRIETVRNDPRYTFMFENANVGGDTMTEVLRQLFRLTPDGKPMTIMQLAGFPAEVVDSVVSVLGRMAFEFGLWSDGAVPLLFICEEAHRYASADRSVGFGPTRKALSRIAKEGRKYGVFLGLVTQRPAELDATIISQCSTLFAMRMANERDQALLRSAVSDAAANLLALVPSLGTGEVLAFGEGVAVPTRLKFRKVSDDLIPRSEAVSHARVEAGLGDDLIDQVVERWRGATMSHKKTDSSALEMEPALADDAPPMQLSQGLNPERFSILKKPVEAAGAGLTPPAREPVPRRPVR
jgi:uncharacterized protein